MTRCLRTIFTALSLCLLLVSARPAAACGGPEDSALMEVYDFLRELGLNERVESVDVKLEEGATRGQASVRLKKLAKPLRLGLQLTDQGWVVTSRRSGED